MLLCNNVRSRDTDGSSSDITPMYPELVQNRWVGFSAPPSPSLDTEPGMNLDTSWWRPNNPSSSRVADPLYRNENNARPSYPKTRRPSSRAQSDPFLINSFPRERTHVGPNNSLISGRREPVRSQILVIPSLPRELPFFPIDVEQSDRPNDISKYQSIIRSRHALKDIAIIPFRYQLNVQRILRFFYLYKLE
jgi:hypothetical protein